MPNGFINNTDITTVLGQIPTRNIENTVTFSQHSVQKSNLPLYDTNQQTLQTNSSVQKSNLPLYDTNQETLRTTNAIPHGRNGENTFKFTRTPAQPKIFLD